MYETDLFFQVFPHWRKVLNARTRGPCPQLYLSLSIEEHGVEHGEELRKQDINSSTNFQSAYKQVQQKRTG